MAKIHLSYALRFFLFCFYEKYYYLFSHFFIGFFEIIRPHRSVETWN